MGGGDGGFCERKKLDATLPLMGVNTFLPKEGEEEAGGVLELIRSTEEEKAWQIGNVEAVRERGVGVVGVALKELQAVARSRGNTFEALVEAGKDCSLGEMSHALCEVG